ncbi:MAG: TonB-dependent receptor [Xanthomonadales bacterium]|nr:TonB-dependent receptor [Xanthomonadales bacterium]
MHNGLETPLPFPKAFRLFLRLLAAIAGFTPWAAMAQEDIEEIAVIGTYLQDPAFQMESQFSLEREELEMMMPAGPEQLLARLPGVSVYRPGGPGGVSEVFLRGAESNFTVVFVDGVRLNNPTNTRGGSFDFSALAANEIERVDIGTGAVSAIYGSDAMAGVVLIETAWPEPGHSTTYAEAGTKSDWRTGAAATLGINDTTTMGLRVSTADGGDGIAGSSLELTSVAARLEGQRSSGDSWQVNAWHVDRRRTSFPEVSGGPGLAALPDLETADGEELSLSAMTEWTLSAHWGAEIIASWTGLKDDIDTPPVPPGELDGQPAFTTVSDYQRGQLLWINRLSPSARSQLAFGFDLVDETGRDDGMVDLGFVQLPNAYDLQRNTVSGFLEWGYDWSGSVASTIAVRLDHTGNESNPSAKIGLEREFRNSGGKLWARVANGFKLPSFFALGNPLFGNPDLVSEKVTSLETGYDFGLGAGSKAGISLFTSRYKDLVDFDFETFTNINRGAVDISGVFLHVQTQFSDTVWLGADATFLDISSVSGPLRRRPETMAGVNLTWQVSHAWSVNANARYVGERLITSIPTGDVVDGAYVIADATARYQYSEKLAVWLAIDNAFDTNYQDAPGFPAPGVRARLGAEVLF